MSEEWLPVRGWEERYEVSSLGNVRKKDGALIGQWTSDHGYQLARLSNPRKMVRVHVLVATAFCANPDALSIVNHIDYNRSNNRADNLEWVTVKQNNWHSYKVGRLGGRFEKGLTPHNKRMTPEQVVEVRALAASGKPITHIAQMFGFHKKTITKTVRGEYHKNVPPPPSE